MKFKDYYQIMGLSRDAAQDEIKRSYRKLARKYHPDVSKEADAESKFKDLNEAYEVLKDTEKRAAYDRLANQWKAGQEFEPPPHWDAGFEFRGGGFSQGGASQFSDFFDSLFGASGRPGAGRAENFRSRGEDRHAKILISLEDAFLGASRTVSLQVPEVDGHGRAHTHTRNINLKIPKGITKGQRIRLTGQGTSGVGFGPPGDLFLEIEFESHPLFRAEGRDIYLDVPISPWEAALGATIAIPTLGGKVDLKIPPESQSGRKLRLRGRGLPGDPPGDLYVSLQIVIPPAHTEAAKAFYRKMADEFGFDPRAHMP